MKIKLARTSVEEVEVDVEFPFFRKDNDIYYAIYSPEKGVSIERLVFLDRFIVKTIPKVNVDFYILNDKLNLEMGYESITEDEFILVRKEFLDRL